jgi:hypothetical protein
MRSTSHVQAILGQAILGQGMLGQSTINASPNPSPLQMISECVDLVVVRIVRPKQPHNHRPEALEGSRNIHGSAAAVNVHLQHPRHNRSDLRSSISCASSLTPTRYCRPVAKSKNVALGAPTSTPRPWLRLAPSAMPSRTCAVPPARQLALHPTQVEVAQLRSPRWTDPKHVRRLHVAVDHEALVQVMHHVR